jgi:hypothetical protein
MPRNTLVVRRQWPTSQQYFVKMHTATWATSTRQYHSGENRLNLTSQVWLTPNLRRGRAAGDAVLSRRNRVEQATLGDQESASAGSLDGEPTDTSEPRGPPRRSSCGGVPRRSWPRPSQHAPLVLVVQESAAIHPAQARAGLAKPARRTA